MAVNDGWLWQSNDWIMMETCAHKSIRINSISILYEFVCTLGWYVHLSIFFVWYQYFILWFDYLLLCINESAVCGASFKKGHSPLFLSLPTLFHFGGACSLRYMSQTKGHTVKHEMIHVLPTSRRIFHIKKNSEHRERDKWKLNIPQQWEENKRKFQSLDIRRPDESFVFA